ncbi:MAG: RluA family pseudouridine synthase [Salinimicrobium sp.]
MGIFTACPTKSALKKALKKHYISVNGAPASTATFISGGEIIRLTLPPVKKPKKKLIFPLDVLFEDEHLAIIRKPAGISVSGNSFKTITNALPQNLNLPSNTTAPQPVHRLDHATSGLLLVGKTGSSIRSLNAMFENKQVEKSYYAITIKKMSPFGSITLPVDGKASESTYRLLDSVASERFGCLNLLRLKPLTGRRHQLRKHLSAIGNPILGDKLYTEEGLILQGKGLYLHAFRLCFKHPVTGEKIDIQDGLPAKFRKIFPQEKF